MKDLKTLYTILLQEYEAGNTSWFLCCAIDDLCSKRWLISVKEREMLFKHFEKQKPSSKLHPEFFNTSLFCGVGVWWYLHRDVAAGKQIRIDFIKKLIEEL